MRRVFVVLIASILSATPAFAGGVDISYGACPGGAGASGNAGSLDCAGGGETTLLLTWQPPQAIPDLLECEFHLQLTVGGDLYTNASFWFIQQFDNIGNSNGFDVNYNRPSLPGCSAYRNIWGAVSCHGANIGAEVGPSPTSNEDVVILSYRCVPGSVAAEEKVFGAQFTIRAWTSDEYTGHDANRGCSLPVCLTVTHAQPRTQTGANGGADPAPITGAASFSNTVAINGAVAGACGAVPARRATWGSLKQLYR